MPVMWEADGKKVDWALAQSLAMAMMHVGCVRLTEDNYEQVIDDMREITGLLVRYRSGEDDAPWQEERFDRCPSTVQDGFAERWIRPLVGSFHCWHASREEAERIGY